MKNGISEQGENEGEEDSNSPATLDKLEQILSQLISDVELFRIELKKVAKSMKE